MRKKGIIITISILAMATVIAIPIVSKAMEEDGFSKQKYAEEISSKHQDEINEIKEEITEIEDKNLSQVEKDKKEKELYAELGEKESEYGLYDYKEEIENRVETVYTAVQDMERDIERGAIPTESLKKDAEYRIKTFTPIIEKYKKILKEAEKESDYDYETLSKQFDDELNKAYDKTNNQLRVKTKTDYMPLSVRIYLITGDILHLKEV